MKQVQRLYLFLQKPFFSDYRTLFGLWLLLPVIATLLKLSKHNNFLIFRYVYWHTIEQLPLYVAYDEYWDTNHYGPFFSLVIAPFAMLPANNLGAARLALHKVRHGLVVGGALG